MKEKIPEHPIFWATLETVLRQRAAAGLSRSVTTSIPRSATCVERDGRSLLHFGSNDYLSLAWHPEVLATYRELAGRATAGSGASPLISGAGPEYERLITNLAAWEGSESAIVFSSGYAANVGTLSAIATRDDLILSDALNHACLIDGCRMSRAIVRVYPHGDMEALETQLAQMRSRYRFAFVVTDTVFSMDGDIAPVAKIETLCRRYDAIGVADEAHASGVMGVQGRGVLGDEGIDRERWIRTGTLSKAVGCSGGFVSGQSLLIRWLQNHARSWIYSTALPSAILGAAARAVELLQGMDRERYELLKSSLWLRRRLGEMGFATRQDPTPIVPVYFRDSKRVLQVSRQLMESGIYVPAIRPPTVPANSAMLRISLNVSHTRGDLERLVEVLHRVAPEGSGPGER